MRIRALTQANLFEGASAVVCRFRRSKRQRQTRWRQGANLANLDLGGAASSVR